MKQNFLDRLKQSLSEFAKNNKTIPRLVELKEGVNKIFDEEIEKLLGKDGFVRRIKVPKVNIKLWRHKNKRIKIPINWKYLLSTPFIYGMIFPSVIFHVGIEIYQQVCFRIYGIPTVSPKDYFVYNRQLFNMLNYWEKVNCKYCSYVNNLIRYSMEIGGRTERYWCPIKYYRKIDGPHSQYEKFIDEDDSEEQIQKREELRDFSDLK